MFLCPLTHKRAGLGKVRDHVMHSFMKRLGVLGATCALMTSLLCACGKDGGTSSTSGTGSTGDDTKGDTTFAGIKFKINENLNFGGKTMIFSGWNEIPTEGVNATWDREIALKKKAEEKYNVKIKRVIASSETKFVQEVVSAYSAGVVFADAIFSPSSYGIQLLKIKGLARPLDDYIDYSNERFAVCGQYSQYFDGKHYSYMPIDPGLGNITYYNPTMLEDNNCPDIMELYNKGEWTWDALNDIVRKCTKDTNGDNVIDKFGVGGSMLLDSLLASNGVPMVSMNMKDKKLDCGLYSNSGLRALDQLRKITFDLKGADDTYGGNNAIINFNAGNTAVLLAPTYFGGNIVPTGMPVKTAPLPKGPDADGYYNAASFCEWNFVAGNSSFKTEEVLQVAMEMMRNDPNDSETYRDDSREGKLETFIVDNVDTGNCFATVEEAEMLFDFIHKDTTKTFLNYVPRDIQSLLKEKIYDPISKGEDPRSYLESVRPVIDEALKSLARTE